MSSFKQNRSWNMEECNRLLNLRGEEWEQEEINQILFSMSVFYCLHEVHSLYLSRQLWTKILWLLGQTKIHKSNPALFPVLVGKDLWNHSHTHSFTFCLKMFLLKKGNWVGETETAGSLRWTKGFLFFYIKKTWSMPTSALEAAKLAPQMVTGWARTWTQPDCTPKLLSTELCWAQ